MPVGTQAQTLPNSYMSTSRVCMQVDNNESSGTSLIQAGCALLEPFADSCSGG